MASTLLAMASTLVAIASNLSAEETEGRRVQEESRGVVFMSVVFPESFTAGARAGLISQQVALSSDPYST